jgi:hypothetical protein
MPHVTTTLTGQMMLAFGDMYAGAALGQRRGITLARSADRYLDQDQIACSAPSGFTPTFMTWATIRISALLRALVGA